jgi:hypothetical protein
MPTTLKSTGVTFPDGSTQTTALDASGVTAGSYGSASAIPVLTIDTNGIVTSASTASVTVPANCSNCSAYSSLSGLPSIPSNCSNCSAYSSLSGLPTTYTNCNVIHSNNKLMNFNYSNWRSAAFDTYGRWLNSNCNCDCNG